MSAPRAATTGMTEGAPQKDERVLVGRRGGFVPRGVALPAFARLKPSAIAARALALLPREAALRGRRATFHVKHVEVDTAPGALATGFSPRKRDAHAVRR